MKVMENLSKMVTECKQLKGGMLLSKVQFMLANLTD